MIIYTILVVCIVMGWIYWYNYEKDITEEVSILGQEINTILISQEANQLQLDIAHRFAISNNNCYGALVSMGLARQYVGKADFATAEKQLKIALNKTHENNLQSIINLRLARVQLQQKNLDGALKTLDSVKGQGWITLAQDIYGDILVVKGEYNAARTAYEKVLQSNPPHTLQSLVYMKLNNLTS